VCTSEWVDRDIADSTPSDVWQDAGIHRWADDLGRRATQAQRRPERERGERRTHVVDAGQFADYAQALRRSDEQILADLDAAAISHSLVTGFDERSTCGVTFVHNESVAALADRQPERFIPFAGADVLRGSAAVTELEHWVVERGFRRLSLRPFMISRPATCGGTGHPGRAGTGRRWRR
jgi:predicted TIM-barrel fold metal-dependent hydrolase